MASVFVEVLLFFALCHNVNALKCYFAMFNLNSENQSEMVKFRIPMRKVEDGCNYCEYKRNHDAHEAIDRRCITESFRCIKVKEWKPENALQRCQPASFYTPGSTVTKGLANDSILCNTDLCNLGCDEYAAKEMTTSIPIETTRNLNNTTLKGHSFLNNIVPWIVFAVLGGIFSCSCLAEIFN